MVEAALMVSTVTPVSAPVPGQDHSARLPSKLVEGIFQAPGALSVTLTTRAASTMILGSAVPGLFKLLPTRFCILLSRSSIWRRVLTVTLTSFKSTMGLQHQCTCWENTVVPTLLQSFSVPTIPFIFGFTQITPLLLEVLLFSGTLETLNAVAS